MGFTKRSILSTSFYSKPLGICPSIIDILKYDFTSVNSNEQSDYCNDGTSKSNDDGVCEVNKMLQNMSTTDDNNNDVSVCANCGKEGSEVTNTCNKCKMVKYCNAACKKKHRKKHKKDCEEHLRLAAERAAKLHDEALFKQPPLPFDDCPICFLRMPSLISGSTYMACCGKLICNGCKYAVDCTTKKDYLCAFCRTPNAYSRESNLESIKKRAETGDPIAMYSLGSYFAEGSLGLPHDHTKAIELWHQAGDLGNSSAYCNIGYSYDVGRGVEVDQKKATHYYELAAMAGNDNARKNLGCVEEDAGNADRALKHWMIAVRGGNANSLVGIQRLYSKGHATKEDYSKALRVFQEYLNEIKSAQKDAAAAASAQFRYY